MAKLYIEAEDYQYIVSAVKKADFKEIGGLGVVEFTDEGIGIVRHNRLLEQEISSHEVEWSSEAHAEYLEWLYTQAGWDQNEYGVYSWHSHGSMDTFFSNTDEDFIQKIGSTVPWVFSSVFNKSLKQSHRLDVFRGADTACPLVEDKTHIIFSECDLEILPRSEELPLLAQLESIEDKYSKKISALEEKRDKETKELKDQLKDISSESIKDITAELEADYAKYVKTASTFVFSGGHGEWYKGKGLSETKSLAKTDPKKKQEDPKEDSPWTHFNEDIEDPRFYEKIKREGKDLLKEIFVEAYDTDKGWFFPITLGSALSDPDIVIFSCIPPILKSKLSAAEAHILEDKEKNGDKILRAAKSEDDKEEAQYREFYGEYF